MSLYDAQFAGTTRAPIADAVIQAIVRSLVRFKHICTTFGVPRDQVRVVATEATREAQNSQQFRDAIAAATGWTVQLLAKADEARLGAWGVASSLADVVGLVMDLGGGSTQLTWLVSRGGTARMAPTPVSLPYGAAALTKRLETAISTAAIHAIRDEIRTRLAAGFAQLQLPPELLAPQQQPPDQPLPQLPQLPQLPAEHGLTLYLSGGGFRGFGYLLLAEHAIQPYPVPIINGFSVPGASFISLADSHLLQLLPSADPHATPDPSAVATATPATTTAAMTEAVAATTAFRISERRARQIPAVALLVSTLVTALPRIANVVFCQGGVREGALYETLPPHVRSRDPLVVATAPFAPPAAEEFVKLLAHALPRSAPAAVRRIVRPLAHVMLLHADVPRESRASCGLATPTTGALASVHGLTHATRALLALALCHRWGGEVADASLRTRLALLVGSECEFWSRFLGAVAAVAGAIYPAGTLVGDEERVRFFGEDAGPADHPFVALRIRFAPGDAVSDAPAVARKVDAVEKVGKKKRCGTFRRKVEVIVERDL